MMKKLIALCLMIAMMLPCMLPAAAAAESMYIIADSNTRALTREELWRYQYDTLMYAFNEIYARHGYRFETGSRCYNWFIQMPWYQPNANETSQNHDASLNQCSKLEWNNANLIKEVRKEMKALGTTNPQGKGLPTPPAATVNKPRGFEYVKLQAGQTLPVYSAPSKAAYRANNGKAAVSTNGAVYALGWDGDWMLMLYEANLAGQYRVGYINRDAIKGAKPALDTLAWDGSLCTVLADTSMTDDPALTGNALTRLRAGTKVIFLTSMFNNSEWYYIETTINGKIARGFVPAGTLSIQGVDVLEEGNG